MVRSYEEGVAGEYGGENVREIAGSSAREESSKQRESAWECESSFIHTWHETRAQEYKMECGPHHEISSARIEEIVTIVRKDLGRIGKYAGMILGWRRRRLAKHALREAGSRESTLRRRNVRAFEV